MQNRIHPPPPLSTPERAPWEDVAKLIGRLNRLIELMEAQAAAAPRLPGAPAPPGPPGPPGPPAPEAPAPVEVTAPWEAKDIEEIYRESLRETGTFYTPRMVDWSKGKRIVLKAHSTLNQSVQITAVGNIRNARSGIVEIGSAVPCDESDVTIGLAWDDWMPYIGAKIVVSTAPTTGRLIIEAVVQE